MTQNPIFVNDSTRTMPTSQCSASNYALLGETIGVLREVCLVMFLINAQYDDIPLILDLFK